MMVANKRSPLLLLRGISQGFVGAHRIGECPAGPPVPRAKRATDGNSGWITRRFQTAVPCLHLAARRPGGDPAP